MGRLLLFWIGHLLLICETGVVPLGRDRGISPGWKSLDLIGKHLLEILDSETHCSLFKLPLPRLLITALLLALRLLRSRPRSRHAHHLILESLPLLLWRFVPGGIVPSFLGWCFRAFARVETPRSRFARVHARG